ncbi:MAG TPA: hypothetical protein VIX82_01180 [Solirubrobacteraceae bacterium]
MSVGVDTGVDRIRSLTYAHPRVRWALREGWGASRHVARWLHIQPPFTPVELVELKRLTGGPSGSQPSGGPRVLFLSLRGWSTHLMLEALFAHAARLRGAEPVFFSCGGRLPICDAANAHSAPPMPCISCKEYAVEGLRSAGFEPLLLDGLVDIRAETSAARTRIDGLHTVAEMQEFQDGDLPLGELVRLAVLWFLARGTLPDDAEVHRTYRNLLVSGQVLHRGFESLLDRVQPERIVLLNGLLLGERILGALAARRGIPVVSYERGYLVDTVVVTPGANACDYLVDDETWRSAAEQPLTLEENNELDSYLDARSRGERAVDNLWEERLDDPAEIDRRLGLRAGRPLVTLFSNILWDTAAQERDIAFPSLPEWIIKTIEGFASRPDVDLIVRLHPAEVRVRNHRTRESMLDVIAAHCPRLPANVRIVEPDDPISSYVLMARSRLGLVYTSTVGMELALAGVPVVVAGRTHYRGRGFTIDVDSSAEYWEQVDQSLGAAPSTADCLAITQVARRYAHLFFFRFMQHLDLVTETTRGRPRLAVTDVADLAPGNSEVLDRIVAGLLEDRPVVAGVTSR